MVSPRGAGGPQDISERFLRGSISVSRAVVSCQLGGWTGVFLLPGSCGTPGRLRCLAGSPHPVPAAEPITGHWGRKITFPAWNDISSDPQPSEAATAISSSSFCWRMDRYGVKDRGEGQGPKGTSWLGQSRAGPTAVSPPRCLLEFGAPGSTQGPGFSCRRTPAPPGRELPAGREEALGVLLPMLPAPSDYSMFLSRAFYLPIPWAAPRAGKTFVILM